MKRTFFISMMLVILLLPACGVAAATPAPSKSDSYGVGGGAPEMAPVMEAPSPAGNRSTVVTNYAADSGASQDRLVIQNADLSVVVKDPQAKMDAIGAMAKRLGGFVVSSNMYETSTQNGDKYPEGSIQIRVPAEKLDDALQEIKDGVVEIQTENRSGQDVTQQYTDLGSQLKNLEATEKQLTLIMEKADKTEDVLAVFNQLTQIRGQIEVTKGQMQYFEQAAALSAVGVTLIAEETVQPVKIGNWKPGGVLLDAVQTLVNFLKGFYKFAVNLIIVVLPAALLIFAVIYGIWQVLRLMWRLLKGKNPFKREVPPVPPAPPAAPLDKQ
jgi:hypothetical protein